LTRRPPAGASGGMATGHRAVLLAATLPQLVILLSVSAQLLPPAPCPLPPAPCPLPPPTTAHTTARQSPRTKDGNYQEQCQGCAPHLGQGSKQICGGAGLEWEMFVRLRAEADQVARWHGVLWCCGAVVLALLRCVMCWSGRKGAGAELLSRSAAYRLCFELTHLPDSPAASAAGDSPAGRQE
jgi:hypothetical protein